MMSQSLPRWSAAALVLAAVRIAAAEATNSQPYRLDRVVVQGEPTDLSGQLGTASVFTGSQFEARQLISPRDLTALVPNLASFDANGDRTPRFSLRGLRENNFSYGESAVAIYVDDVPYSDLFTRGTPLFDLDVAEFLRGPQPTLFGANRPGGVLNLSTRLPSNTPRARATLRYGNYDALTVEGGASGAIIRDQLYIGVSGLFSKRRGFFDNVTLGSNPDSRETLAGRAQLRWTPTDALDFTFTAVGDRFDDGAVISRPIALPTQNGPVRVGGDLFDVRQHTDGFNRMSSHTYSLRGAWTGEWLRLVSVTTRRDWRQDVGGDFDFAEYGVPFNFPIEGIDGFGRPKFQQWTQELRIESPDAASAFKWNVGGFLAQATTDFDLGRTYGPAAGAVLQFPGGQFPFPVGTQDRTTSRLRADTLALFGQVSYTLWERLDLIGGVRFELEDRVQSRQRINPLATLVPPFNPAQAVSAWNGQREFQSVQPRVGLVYRATDQLTGWANFTTGFQPGGFSTSENAAADARYDAAESLHYTAGLTAKLWDGRLTASASGFLIETRDYQVYRPTAQPGEFRIVNAERVRTLGAELEAAIRPCAWFEMNFAGGWQNAEFRRFVDPSGNDFAGRDVNFVPRFTLDASATARHPSGLFATLGVTGVGRWFTDEANSAITAQSDYALLRARVGWENQTFSAAFFGRNLLDEKFYANTTDFGGGFVAATPGDPLVAGVEVSIRF
jgi:iron complex outermembrane recepter protein